MMAPPRTRSMTSSIQETHVAFSEDQIEHDWTPPSSPTVMDGSDIAAATLANVPAAMKFMVTDPEIMAKTAKAQRKKHAAARAKETTTAKKRKGKGHEDAPEDLSDKENKSKKVKETTGEDNEGSDDDEGREITAYVWVEKPQPVQQGRTSRPAKLSEDEKYIQRGPFTLKESETYAALLRKIGQALPCPILNILEDKIKWKPASPANARALVLGGTKGFSAMVQSCLKKKCILILLMPPPAKPAEKPIWTTGTDDDGINIPEFNYADLELKSADQHVADQRATFDKAILPAKEELFAKYPVGGNPLFKDKRIYTDSRTGFHWELTDTRLTIWASHLARGTASIDHPPNSHHFDAKARIQLPTTANFNVVSAALAPAPQIINSTLATPSGMPSMMEMFMMTQMSMLQQQMSNNANTASVVANSSLTNPMPRNTTMPALHIPTPAVSLAAFCVRYHIDDKDRDRLEKLEFHPGDDIESLGPEDWKDIGEFQRLAWQRILQKNQQFRDDIQNGIWNGN